MIDRDELESSPSWRPTAVDALVVLVPWVAVVVLAVVVEAAVSSGDRRLGEYPGCTLGAALVVAVVVAALGSFGYGIARCRARIAAAKNDADRQAVALALDAMERLVRLDERLSFHPATPRSAADLKQLLGDKANNGQAVGEFLTKLPARSAASWVNAEVKTMWAAVLKRLDAKSTAKENSDAPHN